MAKYNRQATNKYYGAANAGYVTSGSSADGLAKALTDAGYKIGEGEKLRIDRKKDKAIAKIDELYANGNTFEQIQSQIIAGKHPELTGKYINATTNYHAGRVKAHEVIKNIEANKDKYDIRNQEMTLDVFYKDFMPDTSSMDSATLLGFTSQFNQYKAKDALIDAENRAAYNTEKKITDGVGLLDDIATEDLKTQLPDFITSLQVKVPNSDGSSNFNLLHTNAETLSIVKRSILDIIANAKTENDLDRADILLNTNLGYSKNGSPIGTLASRKSKEVIAIQDELVKARRTLIANDRQEAEYQRQKEVKKIYAELYSDVTEIDAEGNTITRPRTHKEKMALRDKLEAMGDVGAVANFDKAMSANLYIDDDPEIINQFIEKIYNDDFINIDDMKAEFNKLNTNPALMGAMLDHYENSQKDDNRTLHTTNTAYLAGSKSILNIVEAQLGTLDDERSKIELALQMPIVERHVKREIYDFEVDYFKQNGRKPTNDERQAFMVKLENYIKQIYTTGASPTGNPNLVTFDTQTQNEITKGFNEVDAQIALEEQEKKNNTVISMGDDGSAITLGNYVDTVMENLNTMDVPKLRKTIIEGIISEDEKYIQQTLPKIEKYIKSIMGVNFTKANIEMMSQPDLDNMIIQVAKNLNMTTGNKQDDQKAYQQIEKIFQNLIGE
jgi:hypothetical protein